MAEVAGTRASRKAVAAGCARKCAAGEVGPEGAREWGSPGRLPHGAGADVGFQVCIAVDVACLLPSSAEKSSKRRLQVHARRPGGIPLGAPFLLAQEGEWMNRLSGASWRGAYCDGLDFGVDGASGG
jgi:hypothetical protein